MRELDYPFDGTYILSKKRALKRQLSETPHLTEKRIAIMSGSTIGEVKNLLELFLLKNGIKPIFYEGGYALYYENLVFDDGSLAEFKPDIIYIHTSAQNISLWPCAADTKEQVQDKFNATYARFAQVWKCAAKFGCPVIQNNFEQPSYRLMGNKDSVAAQGRLNFVNRLNAKFAEYAAETPDFFINDIQYLSALVGIDNWFSETTWYAYKYCVDTPYIATLCHSISNIIKSIFGKNKKCVVTDLDNTLWGGIIGDDGPEGIVLGSETPTGMAYSAFQAYLKQLADIGVTLCVCSKNEEKNALAGFERSDTTLKRDDFLCFKANWDPKHLNIVDIAKQINIGTDAIVFTDDNPAEREIVSSHLSGVSVPEFVSPETYVKTLDRAGFFEVTALSDDDKARTQMYKDNLQRAEMEQSFGDYTDYLKSLEQHAEIAPFDEQYAERITQLINKTNQFNLTTKRYTASEVKAVMSDSGYITIYGRLVDKFGDNGIVTAIIAKVTGDTADIELWIMSCRTFKRHLEYAMFDALIEHCNKLGIKKITGHFYPTAKNLLVCDFYDKIGFGKVQEEENGNLHFEFTSLSDYNNLNEVIKINKK